MMRKIILTILSLLIVSMSLAYTVDGNLNDWGLSLNDISVGLCELNAVPNTCDSNITKAIEAWQGPYNAEWIVANNRDPAISEDYPIDWN